MSSLHLVTSRVTFRIRNKGHNSFSEWHNILYRVPQGSIMGPLLFNIYLDDIFYFVNKSDKLNADNCHLLISNHNINVREEVIECSTLLGVTLDKKVNFSEHVSNICKKASQKLHALARISNFMSGQITCPNESLYRITIRILSAYLDVPQQNIE